MGKDEIEAQPIPLSLLEAIAQCSNKQGSTEQVSSIIGMLTLSDYEQTRVCD